MLISLPPWSWEACKEGGPLGDGRTLAQFLFQLVQFRQEPAHAHVGIDAFLVAAAVRGPAKGLDFVPDKAAVRPAKSISVGSVTMAASA